ncbi:MAG: hypothetical protein VKL39_18135 [Leptolyngbyaceae bacterium]|nr:hypothetical protein [Leptolyngbyaceae bacterium]
MNIVKNAVATLSAVALSSGIALSMPQQARADYQSFGLTPGFMPDPQIGTGYSGGGRATNDCGFVDSAGSPDHVVQLYQPFNFLRASVNASGDVTLLIEGPDGRYCSDDANGLMPEISGYWPAGTYNVWIGDWDQGGYRYQFSLSEY